jgi:hypothetical protein
MAMFNSYFSLPECMAKKSKVDSKGVEGLLFVFRWAHQAGSAYIVAWLMASSVSSAWAMDGFFHGTSY